MNSGRVLDLSKPNCHVCGAKLRRNLTTKKDRCVNHRCQVFGIGFNITYVENDGSGGKRDG